MKTGVVLVDNGGYSGQLRRAAEALVGPLALAVVETVPREDLEQLRRRVAGACEEQDQGQGILLLTDLCGSTPSNICFEQLSRHPGSEILTGLNLAMLIKLSTCDRDQQAADLAQELRRTARRSLQLGSELLQSGVTCGY